MPVTSCLTLVLAPYAILFDIMICLFDIVVHHLHVHSVVIVLATVLCLHLFIHLALLTANDLLLVIYLYDVLVVSLPDQLPCGCFPINTANNRHLRELAL